MAEELIKAEGDKATQYEALLPQLAGLLKGEPDFIANLANTAAALKQTFGFFWVGFYRVVPEGGAGETIEKTAGDFTGKSAGKATAETAEDVAGESTEENAGETNELLVLGPFQGPVACSRIRYGKGVCGTAWKEAQTLIVPDVDLFPGHIACNSASRSEIVVPVFQSGRVIAVLDIDSDRVSDFDETDAFYLETICGWLGAPQPEVAG